MRIDHYFHLDSGTSGLLTQINDRLGQILQKDDQIMATIDDLKAAVAAETSVEQSVIALLGNLAQQLKDAIAANDPAALDAVVASVEANTKALSDAVAANTPAAPPAPAPSA